MLYHRSLLLIAMFGLVSSFPSPFDVAKLLPVPVPGLPDLPSLPNPLPPQIGVPGIPSVTGGIMDRFGWTALLRLFGLLPILPVPQVNDLMPYKRSSRTPEIPEAAAVDSSPLDMQDLNRRIIRLEAVLKLEGRIQMVGDKMIVTNGKEVDFETSSSTCNGIGGRIVTPRKEEENTAVLEILKKYKRYTYLGIREGPLPGIFKDLNGVPVDYTKWRKGEPSGKGTEGCVEMYTDGQWNDKACNQNRLTVCEL